MFVAKHHRHSKPPSVTIFQIGLENSEGELIAVAMGARPLSRMLCDGTTIEISRVASLGTKNACSMLYGACCRAAKALGYRRAVTYTLESENGSSLRASGFYEDDTKRTHDPKGWARQKTARSQPMDLFGNRTTPDEPKKRWWKQL